MGFENKQLSQSLFKEREGNVTYIEEGGAYPMNILLIEDEVRLAEALGQLLVLQGYQVDMAHTGMQGEDLACTGRYDVILLDWMLPDRNGVDLLKAIRANAITTPVIFLTAKDTVSNKIEGLDAGADDYLIKPFDRNELLARIRALSRRAAPIVAAGYLSVGTLNLDMQQLEVSSTDGRIKLTPKEAQLLELFMRHKNQTLSKGLLLDRVWGFEPEIEPGNVELYVFYLRKKINFQASGTSLETIRGLGYRLKELEG
jgi:DNA-binding response OmpR family regulator